MTPQASRRPTGVARYVSRHIFGNRSPVRENLRAFWLETRLLPGRSRAHKECPESEILKRQGFVTFQNEYRDDVLSVICDKYRAGIEAPKLSKEGSVVAAASGRIVGSRLLRDPVDQIPELAHLLSARVQSAIRGYYDGYFAVRSVGCWRTYSLPDPSREVYANVWHMDYYDLRSLRLFVTLSDVTERTGAFRTHSIQSSREIVRAGYVDKATVSPRASAMLERRERYHCMVGPPGSALLVNVQRCLHRAGVPAMGTFRDMAQFYIEPSDSPLPTDWYGMLRE